jgi:hypothetical protein
VALDNFLFLLSGLFYNFNITSLFIVDHLWLLVVEILFDGVHLQQIKLPLELEVESLDLLVVVAEESCLVSYYLPYFYHFKIINLYGQA